MNLLIFYKYARTFLEPSYDFKNTIFEKTFRASRESVFSNTWKVFEYDIKYCCKKLFKIRNVSIVTKNFKNMLKIEIKNYKNSHEL